jgi:hypothetical protein
MKHEAAITDYLRRHPNGATIKAISIDLGIQNSMVHRTLSLMPTVWIDRWTSGIGRMSAVYRIVPPDAPKPDSKYKDYHKKGKHDQA